MYHQLVFIALKVKASGAQQLNAKNEELKPKATTLKFILNKRHFTQCGPFTNLYEELKRVLV